MNKDKQQSIEQLYDMSQNALEIFLINIQNGKYKYEASPKTYLLGIAHNLFLDFSKKTNRIWTTDSEKLLEEKMENEEQPNFELGVPYDLEAIKYKIFRAAFELLSSECQQLINLNQHKKDKYEIAAIIGYKNPEHVRERLYRCKMRLVGFVRNHKLYKKYFSNGNGFI